MLEKKILEELVYEKVRLTVDLCELLAFEADLSASIERALATCSPEGEDRTSLTLELLEQAWSRVSEEVVVEMMDAELEQQIHAGCGIPENRLGQVGVQS